MNFPKEGDYIDIHTHDGNPSEGVFIVENLMAHELADISFKTGVAYTIGLHPWFFGANNYEKFLNAVQTTSNYKGVIAIGETGFDKIKGASTELQQIVFEEHIRIAESTTKPVVIHCVKSWDELIAAHKKLKPSTPWLVHGFHGKKELADQLLSRGMFLSVWYSFALFPESTELIRYIPKERIFLETDGADVDIRDIYDKVAGDLRISVEELKSIQLANYSKVFSI
jgi:TatD DNase family protein